MLIRPREEAGGRSEVAMMREEWVVAGRRSAGGRTRRCNGVWAHATAGGGGRDGWEDGTTARRGADGRQSGHERSGARRASRKVAGTHRAGHTSAAPTRAAKDVPRRRERPQDAPRRASEQRRRRQQRTQGAGRRHEPKRGRTNPATGSRAGRGGETRTTAADTRAAGQAPPRDSARPRRERRTNRGRRPQGGHGRDAAADKATARRPGAPRNAGQGGPRRATRRSHQRRGTGGDPGRRRQRQRNAGTSDNKPAAPRGAPHDEATAPRHQTREERPRGGGVHRFAPAPAASQRPDPYTLLMQPTSRDMDNGCQRRFTRFTRPVFPLPVAPGWNGSPWAFLRASDPAVTSDARRGGDRP